MSSTPSHDKEHLAVDDGLLPPKHEYRPEVDVSNVDEKALLRRIDLHIIPWLVLLYLLNFLDRGSIGNARLYGFQDDIGIVDNQYLIALTVFFFPYALFEPLSNVILKRLRPSIWLSSMTFFWGIIMTLHGTIKNYGGLITLRVLLGLMEGGMYPGIVFYISSWYTRRELGLRVAVFFSAATVAGAFSGLLAAAIANMDGVGGKPGWAWIFILEGLVTVLIAVASFWVIQDFPESASFLTEEERVFTIRRLQMDSKFSAAGESFSMEYVWKSLRDWKTFFAMAITMGFDGPLYAFSLFLPSIINQARPLLLGMRTTSVIRPILTANIGFTATVANLLSVPVYVWGCILTCVIGFLGDRLGTRYYLNLILLGIGLIAYVILMASRSPALSYFAVYLAVSAIYPTIRPISASANTVAWIAGNVEGAYKRSVTLGMAIGLGNLNGAITANIYRANDRPWYRLGHGIVLAYIAIGFIASIGFAWYLKKENDCRDRGERDEVIDGVVNPLAHERNGHYESVEAAKIAKGDEWSGFRYTI